MKKYTLIILVSAIAVASWIAFAHVWRSSHHPIPAPAPIASMLASTTPAVRHYIPADVALPAIQARIIPEIARVTAQSPKIFAYAHGTIAADGKLFIGMAAAAGNPFPSNELVIFGTGGDISKPTLVSLPAAGEVDTMAYDSVNDRVYFELSNNGSLVIYAIDPHTYALSALISTSSIDAGRRPAIVTDGTYVYGITNTDPSSVFKVRIKGGELTVNKTGHIPNGHSAAIGIYASSTELYFGGDMSDGFEKADAATLAPIATTTIDPCAMSDDMPYVQTGPRDGYVYIGCERVPYGIRVRTGDMSFDRFQLPGASLGLFVYGNDLYNAAQDGYVDVFPGGDLQDLRRYQVTDDTGSFDTKGQDLEPNEILYSPETAKLYFTAWYGIEGLYEISTSTDGIAL